MKKILISLAILTSCAGAPIKDYYVELWNIDPSTGCIFRIDDNDEIQEICGEEILTRGFISIRLEDYKKELDFQERQYEACKKWKD